MKLSEQSSHPTLGETTIIITNRQRRRLTSWRSYSNVYLDCAIQFWNKKKVSIITVMMMVLIMTVMMIIMTMMIGGDSNDEIKKTNERT
jgi:hypothetical protein